MNETPEKSGGFYLLRHWRGEQRLLVSLLVNTLLLLPLAVTAVVLGQYELAISSHPNTRLNYTYAAFILIGALWIWQIVGVWRSAGHARDEGSWWITKWGARLVGLLTIVIPIWLFSIMANGVTQLKQMASDGDPIGQRGYSLSVDGSNLVLDGAMAWSLEDRFVDALDTNPQITTVVLNSGGGHLTLGFRLADLIRERKLNTYVSQLCASACTYLFLAGDKRYMQQGARIGFHAPAQVFNSSEGNHLVNYVSEKKNEIMRQSGVPDSFISKVDVTAPSDMWFPTARQLLDARVVTNYLN